MDKKLYILLLLIFALLSISPPFFVEAFELKVYDLLARYTASEKPDERIVVVGIDQKALDKHGRWPFSRDIIAELIVKLSQYGAKVVALDISFSTESSKDIDTVFTELNRSLNKKGVKPTSQLRDEIEKLQKSAQKDIILARAIKSSGNVITGLIFHGMAGKGSNDKLLQSKISIIESEQISNSIRDADSRDTHVLFEGGNPEPNIELIQSASAGSGFLNTWTDPDGTIRSHPMVMKSAGMLFPSLALEAVALYKDQVDSLTAVYGDGEFRGVLIDDDFIDANPFGRAYIRYLGPDETFSIISAEDVISKDKTDPEMHEMLKDKIVFIGATATQIFDLRVTPLGIMAGVEIHANQAANILSHNPILTNRWQAFTTPVLILLLGFIIYLVITRFTLMTGSIIVLLLLSSLVGITYYAFSELNFWLNLVIPITVGIFCYFELNLFQYLKEQRSKRFLKDAFERYLSPELISQMIDNPSLLKLGGERKEITAFFSDAVGFTTISERLSANRLAKLLNEYLTEMSDIIIKENGTLDKFIGDSVVAMWGAPVHQSDHAKRAVAAALAQQKLLKLLRQKWRANGIEEIYVRIGLNTGFASVGNMGSQLRFDYTMLGDTVNLASRIEGANKYYLTEILITETTYQQVKTDFLCRDIDRVRVQGKKESVKLYEVIADMREATADERSFVDLWRLGYRLFTQSQFEKAAEFFQACDSLKRGGDGAGRVYINRCAELIKSPPLDDWDCVYDL